MEERRLEGGRLLKAGKLTQAEIARQLRVSRMAVSTWAKRLETGGLRALRKRKARGGRSKLSQGQEQKLKRMLDRGALAAGFATDRWTLPRIAALIEREFGVQYHPNYLNRLLDRLGFSPQKPLARAAEQERELVQAWLEGDWPRIKKVAAVVRQNRLLG